MKFFKSYYSVFEVDTDIKIEIEEYLEELKKKYNIKDDHFLKLDSSNNNIKNKKTSDYFIWKVFWDLKIWIGDLD